MAMGSVCDEFMAEYSSLCRLFREICDYEILHQVPGTENRGGMEKPKAGGILKARGNVNQPGLLTFNSFIPRNHFEEVFSRPGLVFGAEHLRPIMNVV